MESFNPETAQKEVERLTALGVAWATLRVSGAKLAADTIGGLLQLVPEEVIKPDDIIYEDDTRTVRSGYTSCSFSSKGKVAGNSMIEHLKWLLTRLADRSERIQFLHSEGVQLIIEVHMHPWVRMMTPVIDVEMIQHLAQIRVPLQMIIQYQNTKAMY